VFSTFKAIRPSLSPNNQVHQNSRVAWWQVPTLLSLDAPAVALSWQMLLARATPTPLAWQAPLLLFASVWLVYVLDRCLDARTLTLRTAVTPRHRFYVRYARWFWGVSAAVFVLCAVVSVTLEPPLRLIGTAVALLTGLYLAFVHVGNPPRQNAKTKTQAKAQIKAQTKTLPKELQIAFVFSLGVHVALSPWGLSQLVSSGLFALLCFLNCAFIAFWERTADIQQAQRSLARSHPNLRPLLHALALTLISVSSLSWLIFPNMLAVWACLVLSTGLLLVLEHRHDQLSTPVLRVCADVVLLTPCLFLFW
jgi:hypothetical protein